MDSEIKKQKEIKPLKINGILNKPKKRQKNMGKEITKPEIPKPKEKKENETILTEEVKNPIFFSVSEAAKIGGVNTKTIRRAIRGKQIKYKIINNRYFMDLTSIIAFLYETKKLENKLSHFGIGQYVKKWKK